jgi:hypothetical protein
MILGNLYERLPFFTKGRKSDKILATGVLLFTSSALKAENLKGPQGTDEFSSGPGQSVGTTMNSFVAKDAGQMSN